MLLIYGLFSFYLIEIKSSRYGIHRSKNRYVFEECRFFWNFHLQKKTIFDSVIHILWYFIMMTINTLFLISIIISHIQMHSYLSENDIVEIIITVFYVKLYVILIKNFSFIIIKIQNLLPRSVFLNYNASRIVT